MQALEKLPQDLLEKIVLVLREHITEERRERMERVLANRTKDLIVVLEDIFDEHNASAVLRTAEAMGVLEIHAVSRTLPFLVSPKVASGAHKWLDVRSSASTSATYASLRARGYSIWAADLHGESVDIESLPLDRRIALVFGNEHAGLSEEARTACDGLFRVPMRGFVESLNISVAAAVSMHDVLSRRRAAGRLTGLTEQETGVVRAAWYMKSVRAARSILGSVGLSVPNGVCSSLSAQLPSEGASE